MAISFSASVSALQMMPLHSYGASIVIIMILKTEDYQLYSEVHSNISMLMAVKMSKFSLECSKQATGLSTGFSNTNDYTKAIHIVLQEAHLTIKKSLLPSIQIKCNLLSTLDLFIITMIHKIFIIKLII